MAMKLQRSEGIADEALPVAQLAAQMRLAETYDIVPGQSERLRLRLRAAISSIEARLGKVLIAREVVVAGLTGVGQEILLPIAPVAEVLGAELTMRSGPRALGPVTLRSDPHRPVALLSEAVGEGLPLTMTLRAGYGTWNAVPDALQQAVLLMAETLDAGDMAVGVQIDALLAPFRGLRLGGMG